MRPAFSPCRNWKNILKLRSPRTYIPNSQSVHDKTTFGGKTVFGAVEVQMTRRGNDKREHRAFEDLMSDPRFFQEILDETGPANMSLLLVKLYGDPLPKATADHSFVVDMSYDFYHVGGLNFGE